MDNSIKVQFVIEKRELNEIENWLKEESLTSKNGFYSNWNMFIKSYSENRMAILKNKENVIGYTIWRTGDIHIEIDIFEIKPVFRKKGMGKYFLNEISEYFKKKGFLALKLFCEPEKSELFWKEMKFIKFPKRGCSESELTYFKPLIKINQSDEDVDENNKLELWDLEPFEVENSKPKWVWNIDIKKIISILHPYDLKWNMRWTKNGKIVKESMIKDFSSKQNKIAFDEFIYIKKLIE
jgi:predicted GNAT family acetyltransferase